ncbi:T9SS type A sorting domain-containing protein [Winogradskyella algicola]|uniref:T9SS type A sorting domain-containing protein n=1 Tax=Winogradskyella algicola TaxID=2575815 RepID=UPI001108D885|nr:T9SS type A sorting domain-containing protein [Winogradskyella algicola]
MKHFYTILIAILFTSIGFGQTTIAVQDFDGSTPTWNYTSNPAPYSTGSDDWDIVTTNNDPAGTTGSFWGIQDIDNPNGGGAFEHTLTFDAINVSSYNSVEISFDFYTIGFDGSDEIRYEVFYGPVGSEVGQGIVSLNKDTQAWTTITVTIPDTADSAYLVLGAQQNGGSDYAGFDNINIEGIEIVSSNDTDSEIYDSGSQPVGTTLSSLADTSAEAIDVFEFTIEDIGTSDGLSTLVTNVRLFPHTTNTADWTETIQGITLNNGSLIPIENLNITDGFIDATIISGNLDVADGTSSTVTVGVYLNSTGLTDGSTIAFMVDADNHGFTTDLAGSGFATSLTLGDFNSNDFVVDVEATQLSYIEQPSNTIINTVMSPSVEVAYTDVNGNVDIDYSGSGFDIALTTSGSFDASATTTVEAVDGLATFSNLVFDNSASGIVLTAVDNSTLISGSYDSMTFDINLAPIAPLAGDLIITEVSDASNFNNEFIEIYNTTTNIIDMSTSKLVMQSDGTVWDFDDDIANASIPANGFLIVTRGGTQTNFETEFGSLNTETVFVQGTSAMFFGTGTARSWQIYEGGTVSTADGTLIDDTVNAVGGSDRDFFDFVTDTYISTSENLANPGVIDNLVYASGTWKYNAQADENSNESNAFILDDFVASADINTNTFTINPGASLTVNSGVTLDATNGTTLESTSTSYSSLILDGTLTGTVTYNRYVNTNDAVNGNDLISAPLSGQAFDVFIGNNTNILTNSTGPEVLFGGFDNDNASAPYELWNDTDTTPLTAGVGYRSGIDPVAGSNLVSFEGTVNTGLVQVPIAQGTASILNLVGNPFPSYLDAQAFLTQNAAVLDPSAVVIYGYNDSTDGTSADDYTIISAIENNTLNIAPGQGFFVASNVVGGNLQFTTSTPDMRIISTDDDFIAGRSAISNVNINLSNTTDNFITKVYFTASSGLGLDPGYDASLLGGIAPAFSLFSHLVEENMDVPFATQAIGKTDYNDTTIALGVNANMGEQLTFSIAENTMPASIEVYLDDTLTSTSTLLNAADYVLTPSEDLNGTGRFYLRFSNSALSTTDAIFDGISIYGNQTNRTISIAGQLTEGTSANVYDIQGRLVTARPLVSDSTLQTIDASNLHTGVYIVKLVNGNAVKTQKIILK